jgi:hypothetical protein
MHSLERLELTMEPEPAVEGAGLRLRDAGDQRNVSRVAGGRVEMKHHNTSFQRGFRNKDPR